MCYVIVRMHVLMCITIIKMDFHHKLHGMTTNTYAKNTEKVEAPLSN